MTVPGYFFSVGCKQRLGTEKSSALVLLTTLCSSDPDSRREACYNLRA